MSELLPCPFCGGEADHDEGSRVVECKSCHGGFYEDTEAEAIAAWNRRAPSPSPAPGVVTDEMVETAARAYAERHRGKGCPVWEEELPPIRAALASLSQPAKGEQP